ncbi:MAG TPA: hypothetical protein PLY66_05470 [Acidobacteriota bacterium]|nr:hypothetical protein [Acidobacteriota bacterium]HOT00438.1 hypothetical protein [Acidobacteriota bacterium]HQF86289.1 hypothetical protein [Acidobacteriota bacterium]HQG90468.1 hypothetical protein [Acidobacteriota bacterium]HQK86048.1 hypothetical protein [Acidobacteriota bacterium]
MGDSRLIQFTQGQVKPWACLIEGWGLVRGRYWLFVGITACGMLLGTVVPVILFGAMMCGIYLCYLEQLRGDRVEFRRLFDGFQYFHSSLVATALLMAVSLLVALPASLSLSGAVIMLPLFIDRGRLTLAFGLYLATIGVFVLIIMMVVIILGAFFLYTFPLIAEHGLSGSEAVRLGARAARANLWGTVGVMAIQVLLGMVGVCLCYVGAFLVLPVTMGAVVAAYRKVFPVQAASGDASQPLPMRF